MTNIQQVSAAAKRVTLVVAVDPVTRELYGTSVPVLNETATLRRVALFFRGTGSYNLSPDEKDAALLVLRGRFEMAEG